MCIRAATWHKKIKSVSAWSAVIPLMKNNLDKTNAISKLTLLELQYRTSIFLPNTGRKSNPF